MQFSPLCFQSRTDTVPRTEDSSYKTKRLIDSVTYPRRILRGIGTSYCTTQETEPTEATYVLVYYVNTTTVLAHRTIKIHQSYNSIRVDDACDETPGIITNHSSSTYTSLLCFNPYFNSSFGHDCPRYNTAVTLGYFVSPPCVVETQKNRFQRWKTLLQDDIS